MTDKENIKLLIDANAILLESEDRLIAWITEQKKEIKQLKKQIIMCRDGAMLEIKDNHKLISRLYQQKQMIRRLQSENKAAAAMSALYKPSYILPDTPENRVAKGISPIDSLQNIKLPMTLVNCDVITKSKNCDVITKSKMRPCGSPTRKEQPAGCVEVRWAGDHPLILGDDTGDHGRIAMQSNIFGTYNGKGNPLYDFNLDISIERKKIIIENLLGITYHDDRMWLPVKREVSDDV